MAEHEIDGPSITDMNGDSEEKSCSSYDKQGVLSKWTNYLLGWQDRYIVLKDGTLSYYRSKYDLSFGCRGALELARASVMPHQIDECRFDVTDNDSVWYLRAGSKIERQSWIDAIECHLQTESRCSSESNLHNHESLSSLTSGSSVSIASPSSFKCNSGLKEKFMEIETFRDSLCCQIETLQGFFDSCSAAMADGAVNDSSTLQQQGLQSVDFKREAFTFKATASEMIISLSNCIDMMLQMEVEWMKKLEKEVDNRDKLEEAYKNLREQLSKPQQNVSRLTGPDFQEGPHSLISEDEFFDAVDASLDQFDKEEEKRRLAKTKIHLAPEICLSPESKYYDEINRVVNTHIRQLSEKTAHGKDFWHCIVEDGDLKVYKREIDSDGVDLDHLKPAHLVADDIPGILARQDTVVLRSTNTYQGITGHEVCHYFWDIRYRMDWETTLDSSDVIEWLSEDTFVCHSVVKRVWPASQRDALFWTHIRHVKGETDDSDLWIVVNHSTNHGSVESNKYVRVTLNIAMICETIIEQPADGKITRDNIRCKISYIAAVNPGGWAPASVLRIIYKREYPKFLKHFTSFVREQTKDKEIML